METTGRYLALLAEQDVSSGMSAITDSTGVRDIDDAAVSNLEAAVVTLDPDRTRTDYICDRTESSQQD